MQLNKTQMLRTISILTALYCLAFLCSCQKDADTNTPPPITDTTTANVSYMPITEGTYWVYKDSGLSNSYDTTTILAEDTVMNGITFTKVHTVSAIADTFGFYGIKDHNYYLNAEESGITVTMLVLNDTMSVGNSWVYDMGTINNVPARGTGTIVEKLNAFTVQGETYPDVIHSRYVIALNFFGNYIDFATYDFYFAKGKGLIKLKSTVVDTGSGIDLTLTQDLIDYNIK
jgi:hypothetical protein